jgi:glycine betaine/choline ABC-type transport system substrate-binding protein
VASSAAEKGGRVVVGAKDFTESGILAEIIAETLESRGLEVERRELSGNLCHEALISGQIDVYPEYTGTSYTAILHHQPVSDARAVRTQVTREYAEKFNVRVGAASASATILQFWCAARMRAN